MLEPQSRRLLLESLRPPNGYRLDWAVGTTYTLDLTALLTAPVAFAFSDFEDREGRPLLEPLALLKAVREYSDRVCLFCQAGKITVPRRYQHLLAELEGSVFEAFAPKGGSFHPKLWFLRYQNVDGKVLYRLLCLSRNMTFDRSWDTSLCLDGPFVDRVNAFARNRPLGEFVEALPTMVRRELAPIWQERFTQLAHEIRRVDFEVPFPFQELQFWPFGEGSKTRKLPLEKVNRLLVVSPFVGSEQLEILATGSFKPAELISRPESLDLLSEETLAQFAHVWTLDASAEPEANQAEETAAEEGVTVSTSAELDSESSDGAVPLLGLHAKLYVAESGGNAHLWTGSANATSAAFTKNVEFLVELSGSKSKCGIDHLLGRPEPEAKPKTPACLADLLQPYRRSTEHDAELAEEQAFERLIDKFSQQLAIAAPVARCDAWPDSDRFAVTIRPTATAPPPDPAIELLAWPVSLRALDGQPVDVTVSPWVIFESITLLSLTAFFAFEATSADRKFVRTFVLNIPLENAPADRRERILRHLLSDRDRVLKFLLLLLSGGRADEFGQLFAESSATEGSGNFLQAMFSSTLCESLLRALDREPARLDQVASIIADLRQTPEGQELLPADLGAIWDPIWQVRERQRARDHKRQRSNNVGPIVETESGETNG